MSTALIVLGIRYYKPIKVSNDRDDDDDNGDDDDDDDDDDGDDDDHHRRRRRRCRYHSIISTLNQIKRERRKKGRSLLK
ncbi:hypothetical protein PoB_007609300 [Plakobranchus ocellatus]|uniref:Uncharacterized protein n=1 Tax=Plakobranchus ocellatus TaxID=259542 RepID=A0AAV4DYZ9_9GAST|nr:hypothetical protein PoB_007609300 [Plakobranchus ocellatus]